MHPVVREIAIRLQLAKVRQAVVEGPVRVASRHPVIEVLAQSAQKDSAVDRGAAADDASARDGHLEIARARPGVKCHSCASTVAPAYVRPLGSKPRTPSGSRSRRA